METLAWFRGDFGNLPILEPVLPVIVEGLNDPDIGSAAWRPFPWPHLHPKREPSPCRF